MSELFALDLENSDFMIAACAQYLYMIFTPQPREFSEPHDATPNTQRVARSCIFKGFSVSVVSIYISFACWSSEPFKQLLLKGIIEVIQCACQTKHSRSSRIEQKKTKKRDLFGSGNKLSTHRLMEIIQTVGPKFSVKC